MRRGGKRRGEEQGADEALGGEGRGKEMSAEDGRRRERKGRDGNGGALQNASEERQRPRKVADEEKTAIKGLYQEEERRGGEEEEERRGEER